MIIALNNKCNLSKDEFVLYEKELSALEYSTSRLILFPSFTNIALHNLPLIALGAQNVSKTEKGAYTGEIAASQLKSFDVTYCLVGHSERRNKYYETSLDTNEKIRNLLSQNIIPILCVGESKGERESNQALGTIERQIATALDGLTEEEKGKIIIAYEPVWSIGTGLIPTLDEISEVLSHIKRLSPGCKTLYGGSANEENIIELRNCPLIDGYLLGGLSLKPLKLQQFITEAEK